MSTAVESSGAKDIATYIIAIPARFILVRDGA